ncbi:MAG: hypothetical protein A2V86_04305 [Deltaproteobacteria bacterium RBG_16_49_23]|nr:MAG: hypothetical protein A2V86_04305 [Deltaproteobacteria bacterium RBG_16_49_23]
MKRQYIYLLILAALTIPLFLPLGLKHQVTDEVEKFYQTIEDLPPGSTVMVSFDFEASTIAETKPLAQAVLRHLFSRRISVVSLSMLAEGTGLGHSFLKEVADEFGRKYGADYVFLGFRPQYQATILGLGEDFAKVFPQDYLRNNLSDLSLTQKVRNYEGISLIISVADGDLPQYWVDYAQTRFQKPVAAAVTAVMATSYYPYLSSGQFSGLVGGLKGAAEYETLLGKAGLGSKGMEAQSLGHLMIIALIIIGNLAHLRTRKKI